MKEVTRYIIRTTVPAALIRQRVTMILVINMRVTGMYRKKPFMIIPKTKK